MVLSVSISLIFEDGIDTASTQMKLFPSCDVNLLYSLATLLTSEMYTPPWLQHPFLLLLNPYLIYLMFLGLVPWNVIFHHQTSLTLKLEFTW